MNRFLSLTISILAFLLMGCGGEGSTSQSIANSVLEGEENTTSQSSTNTIVEGESESTLGGTSLPFSIEKVAKSNSGSPVQYDFEGYTLQIISSKTLSENTQISHESVVVYGTINGKSTDALLKLNENYRNSDLTLQVFKENRLLFQKDGIKFTNQVAVNFGDISVK